MLRGSGSAVGLMPKAAPLQYDRNMMEIDLPGPLDSYDIPTYSIPIIFLLYSWGCL